MIRPSKFRGWQFSKCHSRKLCKQVSRKDSRKCQGDFLDRRDVKVRKGDCVVHGDEEELSSVDVHDERREVRDD